ncbi:MAG: hypothetical protein RJB66_101 [Pseudomonadota bacterium]|jgi:23S rRNA pseudouridine1911/1915/1917 synthase
MKRIRFFRVRKTQNLSDYLQTHLQLSSADADYLIHLGAIYCNFERVTENISVDVGDILRCHTEPKRFLREINWSPRIVADENDFIVINKPAGLPSQPSLDNRIENVLYELSTYFQRPLFITHRLDVGTSGLMLLAKNKTFQADFNRTLEERKTTKIYEALSLGPLLTPGSQTHWMRPHARAPKILSREPVEKWKICELEILQSQSSERWPLEQSLQTHLRGINYYRLQLHTGRTHQIRAQLSFEQNPLLGDVSYGGPAHALPFEWHALQCSELGFSKAHLQYQWKLPSILPPSS